MDTPFSARSTHPAREPGLAAPPADDSAMKRPRPLNGLLLRPGGILASLVLACVLAGCGPKPPSRSQALQDYQAEASLLDRLQAAHDAQAKRYDADLREIAAMMDQLSDERMRVQAAEKYTALKKRYAEELDADDRANVAPQRQRVKRASDALTSSTPPPQ